MNPGPPDMYYQNPMSAGQHPPPHAAAPGGMSHYPQPQPSSHMLHPGPPSHAAQTHGHTPYPYGYANGLTSPPSMSMGSAMGGSQPVLPLPGPGPQQQVGGHFPFDSTGQNPPPGMKPRVTATLWEDEGSLCFQVEARGICVARREDNHMINGTKLLNVAGMTRGRRDGILKSEKVRHVVKIGPMHLKGVWIPYERALDFSNKEKITELLYPLFVHNIGALLYHPTNQSRTSQVMAAAERRKQEQGQLRNAPLPSIHANSNGMPIPGSQQQALPSNNGIGRPGLDRAHTFPTPPTSASSVITGMGSSDNFGWQGQGMNGAQGPSPMGIDAGLSNTRSMPTTPATTPPGSMQPYQAGQQGYDSARQIYHHSAPSQQSPYASSNGPHDRMYGHAGSYAKNDMGPPSTRPSGPGSASEHHDSKASNGMIPADHASQPHAGEEEGEHEHETEYTTHDSGAYDAQRPAYNYSAPGVGALTGEANIPNDMNGSPHHGPPSGRATPRTAAGPQSYYAQHSGYGTPPRVQQPTSSLYSVMSNDRPATNGSHNNDVYGSSAEMNNQMPGGYATQPPVTNGGMKRGRDDDELARPSVDSSDLKRRKTMESSVQAPIYDSIGRTTPALQGAPHRQ